MFVDFVETSLFSPNPNELGTVHVLPLTCACTGISYFWAALLHIIYVNCIADARVIPPFRPVGKFNDLLVVSKTNK